MSNESNFVKGSVLIRDLLNSSETARAAFERRSDAYEGIELLRDMQAKSGKTRSAIAESMGVKPSRVTQVLRGDVREGPSYAFIKRFARACGFDWPAIHSEAEEKFGYAEAPGTINLDISRHGEDTDADEPELRVTLSGAAVEAAGNVDALVERHEHELSSAESIEEFLMTLVDALLEQGSVVPSENPCEEFAGESESRAADRTGPTFSNEEGGQINRRYEHMVITKQVGQLATTGSHGTRLSDTQEHDVVLIGSGRRGTVSQQPGKRGH